MIRISGGVFKGKMIREVPDKRTRYTSSLVRQALFNMVDVHEKSFLDLFCGSCLVLIEAISRGASMATGVDISPRALSTCKMNLEDLGIIDRVTLYKADAIRFVKSPGMPFDVVFMDPPYGLGISSRVLRSMRKDFVRESGLVVVEEPKREELVVPEFLQVEKVREYGDTKLVVMKKT